MDYNVLLWIGIMLVLMMIEAATMNLVTIWLAIGALASVFATLMGAGGVWQFAVFVIVSGIMLIFTRPLVKKYVSTRYQKTNSDSLIGRTARITQTVNNRLETGTAFLDGKEWSVRTEDDGQILNEGEMVKVLQIEGVKLIVEKDNPGSPRLPQPGTV